MPFTMDSVHSEQSCTQNSCQARRIKNASPVSSLSRNPNTRLILFYVFYSHLGTETILERMNGRASMQAIRRSPSPFYIYCVTQPIQYNAYRSTHSSPLPNITSKQTLSRTADETTTFQRRRASTSTSEATWLSSCQV